MPSLRSQPAVQRVEQAVTEIQRGRPPRPIARSEGAVTFLERSRRARAHRQLLRGDRTAVHHAIEQLVPSSPARRRRQDAERLGSTAVAAHEADQMPYIESLAEHWEHSALPAGRIRLADRLVDVTRMASVPTRRSTATFTAPRHA